MADYREFRERLHRLSQAAADKEKAKSKRWLEDGTVEPDEADQEVEDADSLKDAIDLFGEVAIDMAESLNRIADSQEEQSDSVSRKGRER